jgi:hypothetical protein
MLSVVFYLYAYCCYGEYHNIECHYTECRGAMSLSR